MVEIVIGILATWRIAAWLYLDGDSKGLEKLRERFEFLSCFWCVATWVGIVVALLVLWSPWIMFPFALSGGALLLSQGGRIIWRDMVDD